MQYNEAQYHNTRIGGRIGSQSYRENFEQTIEEGVNRYDLLLLVKRIGREAGFTPRMIQLLDYYINYTRDTDWEQGGQPIVYQSLAKTALDLGVTERQIQRFEKALSEVGAITWKDSGNHKRYGQRCTKSGAILYAYGVDLTPLAAMKDELESKLHDKLLHDQAWMETKRQISFYRSQIRACIAESIEKDLDGVRGWNLSYEDIAVQIRTSIKLRALRELLDTHKALYEAICQELAQYDEVKITNKESPKSDNSVAHYKYPKNKKSNKLDTSKDKLSNLSHESSNKPGADNQSKGDAVMDCGLQHIAINHALAAASDRVNEYFLLEDKEIGWREFIEACYRMKGDLGISQNAWANACNVIGRSGAAICLLLTDNAAHREFNRAEKPAGYFNAMINRAIVGELKLHNSIFGILNAEKEDKCF